jgi:hypothetical protein
MAWTMGTSGAPAKGTRPANHIAAHSTHWCGSYGRGVNRGGAPPMLVHGGTVHEVPTIAVAASAQS